MSERVCLYFRRVIQDQPTMPSNLVSFVSTKRINIAKFQPARGDLRTVLGMVLRGFLTEALSRSIGQFSIRSTILRDFINTRSLYFPNRQWGKNPDVKVVT